MRDNVEHHIEEEEREMFAKARRIFDRSELEALGKRMAAREVTARASVRTIANQREQ